MIVCAHMNLGPYMDSYVKASSIGAAVQQFRKDVEQHYGVLDKSIAEVCGLDLTPCVDLYPACREGDDLHCTDRENFHDYPMARYQIGARGGVRKVTV